ncbi:hypothetical protein [Spirillospora sp. CA-294931]|uniref:hypothetical protein n=1 Tax=Spirillospora sp. CA-294931 TaxID=3240042 RepID=UPI003D8EB7CD
MFELVAWYEAEPVSRERAAETDWEQAAPHPGVAAFAQGFAELRPGTGLRTSGDRYAVVTMTSDEADEVSTEVYALARAHGLTCYDPVRRLVHNLRPTGAYRDMQLHTGDGVVTVDPDLGLVRDVLDGLGPENPFTALVVFGHHFIQVSPEPGGYEMEYKDSVRDRMYRTRVDDLEEVRRAFEEYALDDRAFLDRHRWEL